MKRSITIAAAVSGGVIAGTAAAAAVGTLLWNRATRGAAARLLSGAPASPARPFSPDELEGLPAPVSRYFRFALPPGQPLILWTRVEQAGEFRVGGLDAPWSPLRAVQHYTSRPPGFVWDARIRQAGPLTVRVRDSYIGGTGAMEARIAALVRVTEQGGRPELAAGALHRYLSEAVWFPTALLPSQGVRWEPVDERTARATITDAGTSISLDFTFGAHGEILRADTAARYRDVDGAAVPTPWACHYQDYTRRGGVMVPLQGEAEWALPAGRLSYCRLHVRGIEYGTGR